MDHFVSVHDLFDKTTGFLIVHCPDFLDALVISFFESLEAFLQLDEFVGEQLVILSVCGVLILSISLLHFEKFIFINKASLFFVEHQFETFFLLVEYLLALEQHIVVKAQFFLIKLVNCFHILHALLQNLHLSLQLDLLLCLLVCILAHHIL